MLLSLASLLFFAATNLLAPVLPLYFKGLSLNGTQVGTLISAFMVASICIRPWVGRMVDEKDKKQLIIIGLAIFIACSVAYLFFTSEWILLLIRLLHGIGFALVYTASTSAAVDMIPLERRVEGISHYSNAIKVAMAFSPPLGLWLIQQRYSDSAFWASIGFAVLTMLCIAFLPSSPLKRKAEQKALLKSLAADDDSVVDDAGSAAKGKLICSQALLPGLIMTTNGLGFGALIPYIPLLANEKAIVNPGLFYTVYSFSLIFSRGLTGGFADRFGRATVLWPGMILVTVALFLLAWSSYEWVFLLAAAVYGLSAGSVQPSLLAVAVDRAPKRETGSAMATFTLLNDLGTAVGQFMMAYLGAEYGYTDSLLWIAVISVSGWGLYAWLFWQDSARSVPPSGPYRSRPA